MLPLFIRKRLLKLYKYLPRSKKTIIKEIDGVTYALDMSRMVHSQMYHYGVWEPYTTKIIKEFVKPGMTVMDIGASSGVHTLRMAKLVGETGRVIAFEPSDWMYDKLQRNLKLNSFDNILVEKVALSDFVGTGDLLSTQHGKIGTTIKEHIISMTFATLDSYKLNKLDFIKIDTDGYELSILMGAKKTLKKHHPVMIVEFRPGLINNMVDILSGLGYKFYSEETLEEYSKEEVLNIKEVINVLCKP